MRRGLVLGGGGILGAAWESGVLFGLDSGGLDAARADRIVGTSAGSLVAARVGAGIPMAAPAAAKPEAAASQSGDAFDPAVLARAFALWSNADLMTPECASQIGALALAAPTGSERDWLARMGAALAGASWSGTEPAYQCGRRGSR